MKISVVIPSYNRAATIGRAVRSVLAQTQPVHEIVIVDDGSDDDTVSVLRAFDNPLINIICHEANNGASAARNTAISKAQYDYIAFLDSDDAWSEDKIERQTAFMKDNGLLVSCTNFTLIHQGQEQGCAAYRPFKNNILTQDDFAWGCFVSPGSTMICHNNILTKIGGYDPSYPRLEDWDLLLKITQNNENKVGWYSDSLAHIYLGDNATSKMVLEGLSLIEGTYVTDGLLPQHLKRKVKSSLYFHRASLRFYEKKYMAFLYNVFICAVLYPFNNFPIKAIMLPKVMSVFKKQ